MMGNKQAGKSDPSDALTRAAVLDEACTKSLWMAFLNGNAQFVSMGLKSIIAFYMTQHLGLAVWDVAIVFLATGLISAFSNGILSLGSDSVGFGTATTLSFLPGILVWFLFQYGPSTLFILIGFVVVSSWGLDDQISSVFSNLLLPESQQEYYESIAGMFSGILLMMGVFAFGALYEFGSPKWPFMLASVVSGCSFLLSMSRVWGSQSDLLSKQRAIFDMEHPVAPDSETDALIPKPSVNIVESREFPVNIDENTQFEMTMTVDDLTPFQYILFVLQEALAIINAVMMKVLVVWWAFFAHTKWNANISLSILQVITALLCSVLGGLFAPIILEIVSETDEDDLEEEMEESDRIGGDIQDIRDRYGVMLYLVSNSILIVLWVVPFVVYDLSFTATWGVMAAIGLMMGSAFEYSAMLMLRFELVATSKKVLASETFFGQLLFAIMLFLVGMSWALVGENGLVYVQVAAASLGTLVAAVAAMFI